MAYKFSLGYFLAQTDDYINRADFCTFWGIWQLLDFELIRGCVSKLTLFFPVEMRMVMGVGVKITL